MDSINIELVQMYAAQANSPYAELTGGLDTGVTEVFVNDASVLPSTVPFLLTIGFDTSTSETVVVTEVDGNRLVVTRGVDGPAQVWVAGVKCARIFTAKDLNDIQTNIGRLLTNLNAVGTKVGTATLNTTAADLCGAINEHETDIGNLASDIAPAYVEQNPNGYSIGEYCTHENIIYRCIFDIPAGGETWYPAHWEEASVGEVLTLLQTKVGTATLNTTAADLCGAINEHEADIADLKDRTEVVAGTVTLTNSQTYPFNDSIQTVSISETRDNMNYVIDWVVTASSGGNVGDILISDKLLNGFKIEYTGSATSVTIKYLVVGGMD